MNDQIKQSLLRLKNGNANFVNDELTNPKRDTHHRKALVNSQDPFAVVLTCSDSRIIPEIIFDTGLGELFVIRVAGNVANQSTIASIEYAVAHLNVNLVVVLGHQNCGAVTSALKGNGNSQHLKHLLQFIAPAITNSDSKMIDNVSLINVQLTAEKLYDDSAIISEAVTKEKIKLVPAFYSIETGKVNFFE